MANTENKQIPYESTQKDIRDEIGGVSGALKSTESTSRNVADILAEELARIAGHNASQVDYNNSTSRISADDVQEAIDELASEKVDKEVGKGLSTEDYTAEDKAKLSSISSGAEVNVQSDWNQTDPTQDDYIKNKPSDKDITVTDSFESYTGGKVKSLQMECEPIQDLHGYDHPWVGGAGKNKCGQTVDKIKSLNTNGTWSGNSYTWNGITYTILTDDANNVIGYDVDGTATARGWMFISDTDFGNDDITYNGTTINGYTFTSGNPNMDGDYYCFYGWSQKKSWILVNVGVTKNHDKWYPMARLATESDPTFEPYSNICPISAHTQAKLEQRGKNRFDDSLFDTDVGVTLTYVQFAVPNGNYVMSTPDFSVVDGITNVFFLAGKVTGGASSSYNGVFKDRPISITVTDGYYTIFYRSNNSSNPNNPKNFNWQIELGSSATDYEPYQGKDYTINFGGSYYWIKGDVVSGKWYVVGGYTTINDCISNRTTSYDHPVFYGTISGLKNGNPIMYSDKLRVIDGKTSASDFASNSENGDFTNNSYNTGASIQVFLRMDDYSDVASLKSAIGDAKIVYELATPIPLDLVPQQIEALIGENNFSAPLEKQEIIEIVARNIAEFNEVIDDENISNEYTYSSEKIEDRLDEYVDKDAVEEKSATTEFETINGGLLSSLKVSLEPIQDLHGYDSPWVGGANENKAEFVDGYSISLEGKIVEYVGRCATVNPITIEANTTYYVKRFNTGDSGKFMYAVYNGSTVVRRVSNISTDTALNTSGGDKLYVCAYDGTIAELKPMVTKNTLPTAYSPYSNISPITGHTQVEVDVSDGQTTQEQVTVNLGDTYYSGTLDVVSGVLTVDKASVVFDGSNDEVWSVMNVVDNNTLFKSTVNVPVSDYSTEYQCSVSNPNTAGSNTSTVGTYVYNSSFRVRVTPNVASTVADFTTWLSNNPLQVVYPLATPLTIQLSPTMVKALVGENHIYAPLDGQEIVECKYKQLFTWDEVEEIAQSIAEGEVWDIKCHETVEGAYDVRAYVEIDGTTSYAWNEASFETTLLSNNVVMPPLNQIQFSDSSIRSSSICELLFLGDTDVPIITHVTVSSGQVTFTLSDALESTVSCACRVTNRIL